MTIAIDECDAIFHSYSMTPMDGGHSTVTVPTSIASVSAMFSDAESTMTGMALLFVLDGAAIDDETAAGIFLDGLRDETDTVIVTGNGGGRRAVADDSSRECRGVVLLGQPPATVLFSPVVMANSKRSTALLKSWTRKAMSRARRTVFARCVWTACKQDATKSCRDARGARCPAELDRRRTSVPAWSNRVKSAKHARSNRPAISTAVHDLSGPGALPSHVAHVRASNSRAFNRSRPTSAAARSVS